MMEMKTSLLDQAGSAVTLPSVMAARAKNCLLDTLELMEELATFVEGKSLADISGDPWLKLALQHQVRLVGLELDRILNFDPALVANLPHAASIAKLGETILREYNNVDMAAVWRAATRTIPTLATQIADVLRDYPDDESSHTRCIAVIPLIVDNRDAVADLCRQYGARKLSVFGSAVNGTFNPESSDLDFVVDFDAYEQGIARRYLGLAGELERLFDRSVDLVTIHERTKPWFRDEIDRSAVVVYDAGEDFEVT